MQLTVARPENVPALLYHEKGKLKAWAIGQIKGSFHKSGHNTIDDKQFTVKEFTGSWGTASATSSWKSKLPKRPVVKY